MAKKNTSENKPVTTKHSKTGEKVQLREEKKTFSQKSEDGRGTGPGSKNDKK